MRKRTVNPLLGSVLAFVLLASGLGPAKRLEAASASSATPVSLGGVTRIAGSQPAKMAVRLPGEATVHTTFDSSPDLDIRGKGRFVAFALVPEDPAGPAVMGGRLPKDAGSHHLLMPVPAMRSDFMPTYGGEMTLPAGDYTLYFMPDSAPASVTLRLQGLPGRAVLRPKSPVNYELLTPERYSPAEATGFYSAGSERDLEEGLIFQALWLQADAHLQGFFHFCVNGPTSATQGVPAQVAYGPGCGGSGGGLNDDRQIEAAPHTKLFYEAMTADEPGTYGQGFFFSTASLVTEVKHLALWLSYE